MKHFSTEKDFKNSEEGHLLYTKAVWYMKKVEKWCLTKPDLQTKKFTQDQFFIKKKKKTDMPFNLLYKSSIN